MRSIANWRSKIGNRIWRSLGSLRLAVVLLVLLAAASLVGIILPQPVSFQGDRYVRKRLSPESPDALKPEEFARLARAAGLVVGQASRLPAGRTPAPPGESFDAFLARGRAEGLSDEDSLQRFLKALFEEARNDEESEELLRLAYVDTLAPMLGRVALALRLHTVFSSGWFRLLCALLLVNLVACSLQRVRGQWRAAFGSRAGTDPEWYARRAVRAIVARASGLDESADALERALRARGFAVARRRGTGRATLEAARGWLGSLGRLWWPLGRLAGLGRLGSQVVHLGIVLIAVGGFVSGRLAFRHVQVAAAGDVVVAPDVSYRLSAGYLLRELKGDIMGMLSRRAHPSVSAEEMAARAPDWRSAPPGGGAGVPPASRQDACSTGPPPRVAFRLRLRSFEARMDLRGKPEYYGSQVTLLDTEPPTNAVIEVNHPLVYRGYYVYQQSYGTHFLVTLAIGKFDQPGVNEPSQVAKFQVASLPGTSAAVPEMGLTMRVLRFFPHWQLPLAQGPNGETVAGEPVNASDELVNPAIQVRLEAPGHEPEEHWVVLPYHEGASPHGLRYADFRLAPIDLEWAQHTVLTFKTHPVMLPVWMGCGIVMLGVFLCFYCNHERVWALVVPSDNGSRLHLAGNAFKWRERFQQRFDAVVKNIGDS